MLNYVKLPEANMIQRFNDSTHQKIQKCDDLKLRAKKSG